MGFLLHWVVVAATLLAIPYFVPGFVIGGFGVAMVAAAVLGVVNVLIKPILFILTLPITILTLGLFTFVINALMLKLAAALVPGFRIHGLWPALVGGLILSVVGIVYNMLTKPA
jgi:putative membrane protein